MKNKIYFKIKKYCYVQKNVNLKSLCSIKIGGVGALVCYPKSIRQVQGLINYLNKNKIKFFILGNGTNVVFDDNGFKGVIICLKKLNKISYKKNQTVIAYSGVNLFALNSICYRFGLGGLEFSYGIPGSIGGAIKMNAGAYGKEFCQVVKNVWLLKNNKIKKCRSKQMGFGYRQCKNVKNGDIVLKVEFNLYKESSKKIKELQNEIFLKRLQSQPYGTLNSGSVFKKVQDESAGKYIDKLGLKGVKIGDIQISPKHANFFINLGNATSQHLHSAINAVKYEVKQKLGLDLKEEIIFVGD
ncbi:MAG: UDP-N-acetylmuramate dehydrogenase [Clostridiales bacterium]|nr:UDP-N-acetylmuramate dehydrogenase [Clostridiales bacterium]